MDLHDFGDTLGELDIDEIRVIAAYLQADRESIAGEVEAARASLHVEKVLRATHRRNQAAMVGFAFITLVQDAARRCEVPLPDSDVTRVARAAEAVARALVAGPSAVADAELFGAAFDRASVRSRA